MEKKKKKFPEKEEKSCKGSKAGIDGGGREERKMDGGDGFSHGFYWLAGYFGADAKGEIDNGHVASDTGD